MNLRLVLRLLAHAPLLAVLAAMSTPSCTGATSPPEAPVVVELPETAPASPVSEKATASNDPRDYPIYPGVSVPEAWVDCRTEEDCAIVEAGCCDHCNGGAITTVNAAFAAQAKALLPKLGCDRPCSQNPCDRAESHQLVCMTRACHFDDLEPEVRERIWGGQAADDEEGDSAGVVEIRESTSK